VVRLVLLCRHVDMCGSGGILCRSPRSFEQHCF